MAELVLEFYEDYGDSLLVPIETAICLSVIEHTSSKLCITLVLNENENQQSYRIKYAISEYLLFEKVKRGRLDSKLLYTSLPTVILEEELYYVAGLAAVLRRIVQYSEKVELLGFRQCCLAAPAEVSCWTRFCEVDIVYCMHKIISNKPNEITLSELKITDDDLNSSTERKESGSDLSYLPEELTTLEYHLSVPAKVHQKGKYGEGGPRHDYVEGPHMVVSDLVIAVCVHLILDYHGANNNDVIPFITKWLKRVSFEDGFANSLSKVKNVSWIENKGLHTWCLPKLKGGPVDLYKKEGTRRKRIFTQGELLSSSLEVISEVTLMEYGKLFDKSDLDSIGVVLPDVPKDRLERKTQQLTNLAKAALQVAKEGDLVADLCCGSGHLGLLLATLLPKCTVILLDNKEKSGERARLRVQEMKLNNVRVVQSNLDYFIAKFQVGVSLHACGVASDLVISKCLISKAHLILCPCCYGGIQSNHIVNYPQSSVFQKTGLSEYDFFVLAHNADTCDTEQGHMAMTAVDTDRCLFISENGYSVTLSKLQPPDCTTRNNMIVAVFS